MAVDYTTLFTRLGRFIAYFNTYGTFQAAVRDTDFPDIFGEFTSDPNLVTGLYDTMLRAHDDVTNWKRALVGFAEQVLTDPDLVDELDSSSSDLATMLDLLIAKMKADVESVELNVFAVGAASVGGDNVGDGAIYASDLRTDGVLEERLHAEVFTIACVTDTQTSGTAGQETFQVSGEKIGDDQPYGSSLFRNGSGAQATGLIGSSQLLSNDEFETWTVANTPDDWDVDAGDVGVDILKEASTTFRSSTGAFKIHADGVHSVIGISQDVSDHLIPERVYVLGIWIKTAGVAAGTIAVGLRGTGWDVAQISIPSAWPADWTHYQFFINTPRDLPPDVVFYIEVSGTPTNNAVFYFDNAVLAEPISFAHLYWAVFPGATDWIIRDSATVEVTKSATGVIQTFMGDLFDVQLPSDASPSIDDALAVNA